MYNCLTPSEKFIGTPLSTVCALETQQLWWHYLLHSSPKPVLQLTAQIKSTAISTGKGRRKSMSRLNKKEETHTFAFLFF